MPDCGAIDRLVTPYVDHELASSERAAVESHLLACPRCRRRVESEQTVRDLIHDSRPELTRACASEMLRARCAAHGRAHSIPVPAATTTGWRGRVMRYGLAASLTLAAGGALVYWLTDISSR